MECYKALSIKNFVRDRLKSSIDADIKISSKIPSFTKLEQPYVSI